MTPAVHTENIEGDIALIGHYGYRSPSSPRFYDDGIFVDQYGT